MKAGDIVQVRQYEFLHDALPIAADPPIHQPGRIELWIYAKVLEVPPGVGVVRVMVQHPGNRDDGRELLVDPADVRTKADVEAAAGKPQHPNPNWNAKLQESLKTQASLLKSQ
jgi:hypothetical protein